MGLSVMALKQNKIFKFSFRLVIICLALEIFVFNINSAHLLFGKYDEKVLDISSAELQNFDSAS